MQKSRMARARAKTAPVAPPVKMGAQVYIKVSPLLWGTFLRILEHYPDVQLIDQIEHPLTKYRTAVLRGLIFPASWENCELDAFINHTLAPNQCLHFEPHGVGVK